MATTYYYCNGEKRRSTSVTMTSSSTYTRSYTIGEGTNVYESYKNLTFNFTPAVIYTAGTGELSPLFRVRYSYEFRTQLNYDGYTSWNKVYQWLTVPTGTSTKTIEVLISRTVCYADGTGDETY